MKNIHIVLLLSICCLVFFMSSVSLFLAMNSLNAFKDTPGRIPRILSTKSLPITNNLWKKGSSTWNTFQGDSSGNFTVKNDILRLEYEKNAHGGGSGASFKANPKNIFPTEDVTFSYSVEFPDEFDFKKGGKLPGICIGTSKNDCSAGGDWKKGQGSVRIMWRATNGKNPYAIAYVYTTHGDPGKGERAQGSDTSNIMSPSERTGHNFWKKGTPFRLKHGWNTISLRIKLNSPGKKDGVLEMTVNGTTKRVSDAVFRETRSEKIQSLNFVSFFGGGDSSWSTPNRTLHTNFKNISVGH